MTASMPAPTTASSTPAARLRQLLPQLFEPAVASGDRYLQFQIAPELSVLLPMAVVQEATVVAAERVTRLPGLPVSALGMLAMHERIFCAFDLPLALGIATAVTIPQRYQVAVVRLNDGIWVGLSVLRLQGVLRCDAEAFRTGETEDVAPALVPFLSGVVDCDGQVFPVLSLEAIAADLRQSVVCTVSPSC